MKLDRKKTYETVHGAPGIAFHQDGVYFNGSGEQVTIGQVDVQDEKGEMIKQDVGVEIENKEPIPKNHEKKSDIPEFKKPEPKKYVNVMSIADCEKELDAAGIDWRPAIEILKGEYEGHPQGKKPPIRATLRDMVKDIRKK